MKGTEYLTKEAVLKKGREAIGIPLKDIDKKGRLATGKGAVGTVVEINNDSAIIEGVKSDKN